MADFAMVGLLESSQNNKTHVLAEVQLYGPRLVNHKLTYNLCFWRIRQNYFKVLSFTIFGLFLYKRRFHQYFEFSIK